MHFSLCEILSYRLLCSLFAKMGINEVKIDMNYLQAMISMKVIKAYSIIHSRHEAAVERE